MYQLPMLLFAVLALLGIVLGDCPLGQSNFSIEIVPDANPEEVSWQLYQLQGVRYSQTGANSSSASYCINAGDFLFNIGDEGGDGICCDFGAGSFEMAINSEVILNGSDFGSNAFLMFKVNGDGYYPTLSPTADISAYTFTVTTDCAVGETELNIAVENGMSTESNSWFLDVYDSITDTLSRLSSGNESAAICLTASSTDYYVLSFSDASGGDYCCGAEYVWGLDRVAEDRGTEASSYAIQVLAETGSPTVSPTAAPAVGSLNCLSGEQEVYLVFSDDIEGPSEFEWEIRGANNPTSLIQATSTDGICLPYGFYVLSLRDSGQDGFSTGSISLTVNGQTRYTVDSTTFTSFLSHPFEISESSSTASPTPDGGEQSGTAAPTISCFNPEACEKSCSSLLSSVDSCLADTCICTRASSLIAGVSSGCYSSITSRMQDLGVPSASLTSPFTADDSYLDSVAEWTSIMNAILLLNYTECLQASGPDSLCLYYRRTAEQACEDLGLEDSCDMIFYLQGSPTLEYYWPYCFPSTCTGSETEIYSGGSVSFTVSESCSIDSVASTFASAFEALPRREVFHRSVALSRGS